MGYQAQGRQQEGQVYYDADTGQYYTQPTQSNNSTPMARLLGLNNRNAQRNYITDFNNQSMTARPAQQFTPIDIVKQLKNIINDKDYEELIPYYRGFTGTIKKVGNQQFEVNGCYEIVSEDTVHITEIPISLRSMSFEK